MNAAVAIVFAVLGILLGWIGALLVVRRSTPDLIPDTTVRDKYAHTVLAESRTGYAILDSENHVLLANARAGELGVVRAGMADRRILDAAERAALSGDVIDVQLADRSGRGGPSVIQAEVRALSDGSVFVVVADESAAARVEAIRRDFIANVSHELKTPIGSISLLAEAVMDGSDEPEMVRKFAGKMVRESTRLGALVTELIALSRLQGGETQLDHSVVEVDSVIGDVLNRTATIAEAAGVDVSVGGTEGLLITGDRTLLVTALTNLVDNAIHYSPAATPVSISRVSREGGVEISVTDRGTGIAAAHQERVFERFFRADPARSRNTGGTGLGLAIVKHVAANHGGEVTLFSRVGIGSTFTLKLPSTSGSPDAVTHKPVTRATINGVQGEM
ncbi:two-component sensor histidine kinase [Nakamurella antarctica]|uniref:Sensor-like histidine kinase SenX3 n=1 Tax=Nakamurella antarctica TaxID=1902245 RepID=A0A3G8ZP11_9ACTN|nr:ATP-binding protein [Nakamurella antarctica]AZI58990.1 two-component sensor histidine kinase [Nakamurella antarctica]